VVLADQGQDVIKIYGEMGCKCLILKTWDCRGGVSWLNGGGFSFWGGKKCLV